MKAVVQRVREAQVTVEGVVHGKIPWGLLVYIGVAKDDREDAADWLAEKIANLRVFNDPQGRMNLSVKESIQREKNSRCAGSGETPFPGVLVISQFTLLADARRGRRPYYGAAAEPEKAKKLYEHFIAKLKARDLHCESGVFQAHMEVTYTNDGPVTIILDTKDM
jgi:D-tyrosyl-tRNA(Tyr) deacylase